MTLLKYLAQFYPVRESIWTWFLLNLAVCHTFMFHMFKMI